MKSKTLKPHDIGCYSFVGGSLSTLNDNQYLDACLRFDPANQTWSIEESAELKLRNVQAIEVDKGRYWIPGLPSDDS